MSNADGRNLPDGRARLARAALRGLLQGKGILIIPAVLSALLVVLLCSLSDGRTSAFEARLDPPMDADGFPNLGYHVRSHWIDGKTLYYSRDETIAVRDIETGTERTIPFGAYEVKSLIVKGNEIALTARTKETVWDRFRGWIRPTYDMGVYDGFRFSYPEENDVYNGIICGLDTGKCEVKVSGNYVIRDFQPFQNGYVFSKTEWDDFSLGADWPLDFQSSIVMVTPDRGTVTSGKFGGIQSLFVSENGAFIDIRNADERTFPPGQKVYRWSGGDLHTTRLVGLKSERYRDAFKGQLRTDGFHWALSSYNVENGRRAGLSSNYFCNNRMGEVDSKTALFLVDRSIAYIDSQGKLVALDCKSH